MALDEDRMTEIVRRVINELSHKDGPVPAETQPHYRGVFGNADDALRAVGGAAQQLAKQSIAQRRKIVEHLRAAAVAHSEPLAKMAAEESRMGRPEDKAKKHRLLAEKTPGVEALRADAFVGDDGLTTEELAPFGTILAVTPTTNPTATLLNNAISMLAAGNTIYFAPHPRSLKTSLTCIDIINQAVEAAGGPANTCVTTDHVDLKVVETLMRSPKIALLCVTGGTGVVDLAMTCGKRVIGAAAGNPPVLVDDSADPERAARDIVLGHSFDNNLPCIAEKEVIATAAVAGKLMDCFRARHDAVVLDQSHLPQLEKIILNEKRSGPAPKMIGQNANIILRELGISAGDDVRTVIVETDKAHPFVQLELMIPVLAVARVTSFDEALETAVEAEHGLHHSAIIHSANIYHMSEYAKAMKTTILVKNAPSYAGIGLGGEGHAGFTIAGRTGDGIATARTFSRVRRCSLVGAFSLA